MGGKGELGSRRRGGGAVGGGGGRRRALEAAYDQRRTRTPCVGEACGAARRGHGDLLACLGQLGLGHVLEGAA